MWIYFCIVVALEKKLKAAQELSENFEVCEVYYFVTVMTKIAFNFLSSQIFI